MEKTYGTNDIGTDLELFESDLASSLFFASGYMQGDMINIAQFYLEELVYSYIPVYSHRRFEGEAEPFEDSLHEKIEFEDVEAHGSFEHISSMDIPMAFNAPWQHEGAFEHTGEMLADAIEEGTFMGGAGARPFTDKIDWAIETDADVMLQDAIEKSGYL